MAGLADFCGDLLAGYTICGDTPGSAGVENFFYAFDKNEFTITYDATNPLIITGLTPIGDALLYKFNLAGDKVDTEDKIVQKKVGPRYQQMFSFPIPKNSVAIKKLIHNGAIGRWVYIAINNDKQTDAAIEAFGVTNGLKFSENTTRKASDEDLQGGWNAEATNPAGLLEPLPARVIAIPPAGSGNPPATYASSLAALEALLA